MAYETVTILDALGNPIDIVVDTLASGAKIQVVRADLGVDTSQAPVSGTIPVSLASLPLPSGASTSALQTTGNTHLATIAGAISGGEMQVSVAGSEQYTEGNTDSSITGTAIMWEDASDTLRPVSAAKPLPSSVLSVPADPFGVNADSASSTGSISAKLRFIAATGIPVTSVVPGTGATNLGKAKGNAVGSTDTGIPGLLVRDDVLTTLEDPDGDYVHARVDSVGRVWVSAHIPDSLGNPVSFDPVRQVSVTPTLGTGANVQFDSLHSTPLTVAAVVNANGGTGHILGATLTSRHNTFDGMVKAYLFDEPVTGTTAQDPLSVSDTDMEKSIGTLLFDLSGSNGGTSRTANASRLDLPIPFKCSAGTDDISVILQLWSSAGVTFGSSDLKLKILVQPD